MCLNFNAHDKKYLKIALPAAIENIFMIFLAAADLIMVGSLGTIAISAVSIFLQPRLVLLCVSRSIASTVSLLTAHKVGSEDYDGIASLLYKSLFLCTIVMGVLHFIFYINLQDIFILMGASADYLPEAMNYGKIATISVFFTSVTLILQAVLLGFGQTSVIMKTNILGNIVNVICNAFLIFGLGPFPALGVTGAAIGTVIGTSVTLMASIYVMKLNKHFSKKTACIPDIGYFKEFLPIFGGIFSEMGFERIGMVLFARMAAGLGTVAFAVHSICMNICDIYYDFALGMGKASMILAGQSCGAKNIKEWQHYKKISIKWCFIFSTISFILTLVFKKEIFGIYSNDPQALLLSGTIMLIVALVSYPEAYAIIFAGILRGSGYTKYVAMYSFFLITILRPLVTAFFLYYLELGLTGVWLALILDQTLRAACSTFLIHRLKPSF